jgi:FkbM family methyltransferase
MILPLLRSGFRAYRKLRLRTLAGRETWYRVPGGFYMRLDPKDWIDVGLMFGTYEPGLRALVDAVLRAGESAVDVGTHKGYFTLQMAGRVGSSGAVLAVDPDPRAYGFMLANVERNAFTQVLPLRAALGDANGDCEISLNRQLGNSSRFPNIYAQENIVERVRVPLLRLDDVLASHGIPEGSHQLTFVKIDAEGSEPLILAGMRATLRAHRPVVFLEVNFRSLEAGRLPVRSIEEIFAPLNYEIFRVEWSRSNFGRVRLRLVPCILHEISMMDMIDAVAVAKASPLRARLAPYIVGRR